ncbi:hypothetical protein AB205_0123110 [Aquarana catesbeiana]|uniref:Uncharacterized protein n=1 Tax=Aquarana catesbeiana TaxID=8400 RepID=A0A2G9QKY9_AQUCT|nr:hypothetical protein AB205_0123110 [Aquarana catesbeiana]
MYFVQTHVSHAIFVLTCNLRFLMQFMFLMQFTFLMQFVVSMINSHFYVSLVFPVFSCFPKVTLVLMFLTLFINSRSRATGIFHVVCGFLAASVLRLLTFSSARAINVFCSFTQLTFLAQVSQSAHVSLVVHVAVPVVCHFHSVHGYYLCHFAGYCSYVLSSRLSWSVLIGVGSSNYSHPGYILISVLFY